MSRGIRRKRGDLEEPNTILNSIGSSPGAPYDQGGCGEVGGGMLWGEVDGSGGVVWGGVVV